MLALHQQRKHAGFFNDLTGHERAVKREQHSALGAKRSRNYFAFLIAYRNARPVPEKRAFLVKRTHIHMRDFERHFEHRQRSDLQWMRMNDAVHIGPRAINPRVESIGRRDLVEIQIQRLREIAAECFGACGDLSGKSRIMSSVEHDAARYASFSRTDQWPLVSVFKRSCEREISSALDRLSVSAFRLKILRRQMNMSLQDLADQTELTKSYLSKVERGLSVASVAVALKLAKALHVEVDQLFDDAQADEAITVVRVKDRVPMGKPGASEASAYEVLAARAAISAYCRSSSGHRRIFPSPNSSSTRGRIKLVK